MLLKVQPTLRDGPILDPFSFCQNRLPTSEVNIGRRQVFQALMVSLVTSRARRVSSTVRRKRSALSWTVCVAKTALPSFAAEKALPKVFITNGPRTSWRPARSAWPAILSGKPTRVKSQSYGVKPEISKRWLPNKRWNCGCSKKGMLGVGVERD